MKNKKGNKIKTAFVVTTAILALISMLPVMVSAQSDIRINEIMYNPSTEQGSDSNMEWIELYNNDVEAVNISGWTIDGKQIADKVMQPGDYVVLARNKTAFDADYGALPCSVIATTFVLNNDPGDTIVLCNSTGAEVDNVTYDASWGADGNGKTLERNVAGWWEGSLADGGTPCELNSVKFVIPFSSWGPPVIYTWNITADAMNPENVGKNATTELFTATEEIDNETYYVINTIKPTGSTKLYVGKDDVNEDDLRKRVVTEMEPGVEIVNLTFDPAFVNWDYPLRDGKTWNGTTDVTGMLVNETGSEISINSTAVVSGKITAEVVKVPLGWFPCLVIETNISYEVAGQPTSNLEKSWISPTDNGYLTPKYQSYLNGTLVDELVLIEVIPPTFLNATDNNTTINVTAGEFLVVTLEGNPTTGYTWEVTEPLDEQVLRQVGEIAFVPESDLIGAGGVQIATFEAVGAGEATIKLVYHRPWETEVEPVDTFTVNVTVANGLDAMPPQVTNARANPPVIAVITDITELRVDAAGIESPIDVVTVDLSPIGGNARTVMFNIGNYTKDNISWTMYNYTTNASVEGTFNLTVNATDINGNYNDTVNITLEVKKAVIPFSMITPGTTYIMNITYDIIPPNVGENTTLVLFSETAEIDNETYFVVNGTKPIGGTKFYSGANFTTEDFTMKRIVSEGVLGEVANLTFDPACVLYDYPLWVGKTWTTTANVTGMLVDATTGAVIPINTSAVVTGNVTREEYLTVPYGTNIHCLVVEINVSLQHPPISLLIRQWWSNHEMALMPKYQNYVSGSLIEELELIGIVVAP